MQKIKKGFVIELKIDDWANEGKGIAKINTPNGEFVVFVPNAIPGQLVKVRIVKAKRNFAEAKLLEIIQKSELEQDHAFQSTPGAPYIGVPIAAQQDYKKQSVFDLFERIGKIEKPNQYFDDFIESPRIFHYRNKMEYSFSAVASIEGKQGFSDEFVLGFKKRGQWLAVEPLSRDSGMFDTQLENAFEQIASLFKEKNHSAWHSRINKGFCRFLAVRKSFSEDKLLVNLVTTSLELDNFDSSAFTQLIRDILGNRLGGLIHTVNDSTSDRPDANEGEQKVLFGEPFIYENLCGLKFKISPESFFQTNPASAEKLYEKALNYVFEHEEGNLPIVLDLFSGTGTITQLLAQRSTNKKIIGVEIVAEAVDDAVGNAKLNGLADKVEFYQGDVGNFLLDKPELEGQIETVVLDPPRAGITPKTLRKVMRLGAKRMVYVSCNPATQARDLEALQEFGYRLNKFSLVDQFPHTAHVETVALFEKID